MTTSPLASALFDLQAWDALDTAGHRQLAEAVAARLRGPFSLVGLEAHVLGGLAHEVAVLNHEGNRFVLVPGFRGTLGYDRGHPFVPSSEQSEDWKQTQEEIGMSLADYLDLCLAPLRTVAVGPMLMEVIARPCEYRQDGAGRRGDLARVREACEGGFRLPTPDEWEYACGAGARSLFRWGDGCPISRSYHERGFDLHRRPNAFGLRMPWNIYDLELCVGGRFRGGDGGASLCWGCGNVITWMPLATAFRIPEDQDIDGWCIDEVWVRRVYPPPDDPAAVGTRVGTLMGRRPDD